MTRNGDDQYPNTDWPRRK